MRVCQNTEWEKELEIFGYIGLVSHIWSDEPLGLGWDRKSEV